MRLPRRFDNALMRAPEAGSTAVDAALLGTLRTWCEAGAGPRMTEPLRVAGLVSRTGLVAALDAVACELDGSHALARLGRWRGRLWRLQLLAQELVAGRDIQPASPWDCGWWREGPPGPAAAFSPRRPTLLMLHEPDAAALAALLAMLRARSPGYARPLRVLVVSAALPIDLPRL
ncbi:hypothetical protein [Aquabacterium sp.]|uniref:hypothetical protein n=1 Tax=Aquabacterium sp. TaxID=1872578 RepID=UPI003783294F